jgi:DNA-binding response OmpR family regulator
MSQQRILVVEDDAAIRLGIRHSLRFNGYEVSEAEEAREGGRLALEGDYDLLLLDLNLPGGDGLNILHELRSQSQTRPVIILTARGEEVDRVKGLKLGADDYVVKPFGAEELLARIEAVLRRSPVRPRADLQFDLPGLHLDFATREIRHDDGEVVPLSELEAQLLAYFVRNPGRNIGRDEILARVWRLNPDAIETRTVDMHVMHLRTKLRDDATDPRLILTVRGKGYRFAEPLS